MKPIPLYQLIFGRFYAFYALACFILLLFPAYFLFLLIHIFSKGENRNIHIDHAFKAWMDIYMPLIFCPVRKKGLEYFMEGQQYVVIINHNSLMDIPVSSPGIPGPNRTLGKDSFAKIPLFGLTYKMGSILVNRDSHRSKAESFIAMKNALQNGLHICLYPEGTRNKSGELLLPFKDGAFKLALKTKKAIMPAVLKGTKEILPANGPAFWAWPHRIEFIFLPPIEINSATTEDELKEKSRVVMLAELRKSSSNPF
jgi:1-acyl-sn-glycerol-3-phosphate acyltransferase